MSDSDEIASGKISKSSRIKASELAEITSVWGPMESFFPAEVAPRAGPKTYNENRWKSQAVAKPMQLSARLGEELVRTSGIIRDPTIAKQYIIEAYELRRLGRGQLNREPGIRPRDVKAAATAFRNDMQAQEEASTQDLEEDDREEHDREEDDREEDGSEEDETPGYMPAEFDELVSPRSPPLDSFEPLDSSEPDSNRISEDNVSPKGQTNQGYQEAVREESAIDLDMYDDAPRKRRRLDPGEETFETGYIIDRKRISDVRMNMTMSKTDTDEARQEMEREKDRNHWERKGLEARVKQYRAKEGIYRTLRRDADINSEIALLKIKTRQVSYEAEEDERDRLQPQ